MRELARELAATEASVDKALAQAARLMRRTVEVRRGLGLTFGVGEPAMMRPEAVLALLGEAQRELVKARLELSTVWSGIVAEAAGRDRPAPAGQEEPLKEAG